MSQLLSIHRAGVAFVNSLALHQNVARKVRDPVVAATGLRAKQSNPRVCARSDDVEQIARSLDF
jgi:hypothetical protein